ncbi:unnamed protein product [Macrosiphum euphorbiae]|uniref:Transposable element P transposase-like RNase H domain-containing protein n=1 Tax=Macrosiphum euphorbiae TaxID=13131 RepID=A0AAV0W6D4_9HEMI|nr:unnamed protein product [Macrosiphum euphorbiae]
MLLCLLFQIRSPSGYKFLREQNILPLPCINTIRKHLLAVEIRCGFDKNLFKLLTKRFATKNNFEKKGILLFDEISLREGLSVNTRELTYTGLEDFGEEIESKKDSDKKANHGLVFMWQSLAENFVQPIAVFASHGPVKGIDLAKLIIKAIILIEKTGGQIVGVTSDGAATNRNMWSILGVSGKKNNFCNFFENPYDSARKVYVFSDVPHLMKTIRNRLFTNKELRVN